jgi:hypothetical protein
MSQKKKNLVVVQQGKKYFGGVGWLGCWGNVKN